MNNIKLIEDALQNLKEERKILDQLRELLDQKDRLNIRLQVYKLLYGPLDD